MREGQGSGAPDGVRAIKCESNIHPFGKFWKGPPVSSFFGRLKKPLIWAAVIIACGVIYFYVYPEVASHLSQKLEVTSASLKVKASYYQLTLDGMDSLFLRAGEAVVSGFDMGTIAIYRVAGHREVARKLPDEFGQLSFRDTSWILVDSHISKDFKSYRVFRNQRTAQEFTVTLPWMNDQPNWLACRGDSNRVLFVLAAGNWKRGDKVYLAYIEVQ